IGVWFWAVVCHGVLTVLDSANAGFQATYKIVAFGSGAAMLLVLIPLLGPLLAILWLPLVLFYGFTEAHDCKGVTAILIAAISIPFAAVCTFPILAVARLEVLAWLTSAGT